MDEQQQRQINAAAEKFADALKESYQAVAGHAVSTQQLNTELTQNFFNSVIDSLRRGTESDRELAQELIKQQERQREASQEMAQECVAAYMKLMDYMFSYYQLLVASRSKRL